MKYKVLNDKGVKVAVFEVDLERLRVTEQTDLFKEVMREPLEKGLFMVAGGSVGEKRIVDEVRRVKEFNLLNLGLLEEHLVKHGYTLEEVK